MCNAVSFFTFHVIPLYSVLFHLSCRVFIFILKGFTKLLLWLGISIGVGALVYHNFG